MREGALVLVVGPSGAGKDTMIRHAQAALAADARFSFPRRIVTRAADPSLEDHDTVEPAEFARQKLRGDYALDWEAHGLSYALPGSIDATIHAGRIVVANGSRRIVARAVEKYSRCHILVVTARPEVLAERLKARSRETVEEIAARLDREAMLPPAVMPILIDNSGPIETGARRFIDALLRIAQ
jgi:ribose 1,5-bisphosphokinase